MAPLFGFYDYEAHFSHQRCIEEDSAPVIRPQSELKQDPGEIGSPEHRHCPLCNVYFGTMDRLEIHNRNTHSVVTLESLARENLEFTLQLRREYVEQLWRDIERATEEEFELQEKQIEQERLFYEKRLEQWRIREQPLESEMQAGKGVCDKEKQVVKRPKKGRKDDAKGSRQPQDIENGNTARTKKTHQRKKGPSIGIVAVIPGGRIKPVSRVTSLLRVGVCGAHPNTDGCLCCFQPPYDDPVATYQYCPICRVSFRTTSRYNKHKTKVHKDFEGDLAQAERKRWEKAERRRLREEEEEKRRRAKAEKGRGKGKGKGKGKGRPPPLQTVSGVLKRETSMRCEGCRITFSTCELFDSHKSKYRELGLSHKPAFTSPSQCVVAKQSLHVLKEGSGSKRNTRPNETISSGTVQSLKRLNRMAKMQRRRRRVERKKE
ncbi:hypothetical protein FA13DRAFT_672522 [Coprinellus micaceus]|uniref:C2H2-type domain-containing protein n=1 Tax=Coprinellus micaceus TaxID=71717 RepID=A0A4Y7T6V9_COPMI|nr:hypothetical protein FA13DRAFT_672522 [Coprinellus micaceus]